MQQAIDTTAASAFLYVALFLVMLMRPRRRRASRRAETSVLRSRPSHEPPPLDMPASSSERPLRLGGKRVLMGFACGVWGVLSAVMLIAALLETSHISALADASNRTIWKTNSTSQYTLTGSNGSTWSQMDNTNLTLTIEPTVNSTAVLSANSTLFTNTAGYNQDLAICVNPSTSASCTASGAKVAVWKEAGGYSAYKPATVYDQAVYAMSAGTTYTVSLYWKTNTSDTNTIYAGAGSSPTYSPTSLSAVLAPTSESLVASAISTGSTQYSTSSTSWVLMDSTNLDTTFTAPSNGTALLTANADVFTSTSGTKEMSRVPWNFGDLM